MRSWSMSVSGRRSTPRPGAHVRSTIRDGIHAQLVRAMAVNPARAPDPRARGTAAPLANARANVSPDKINSNLWLQRRTCEEPQQVRGVSPVQPARSFRVKCHRSTYICASPGFCDRAADQAAFGREPQRARDRCETPSSRTRRRACRRSVSPIGAGALGHPRPQASTVTRRRAVVCHASEDETFGLTRLTAGMARPRLGRATRQTLATRTCIAISGRTVAAPVCGLHERSARSLRRGRRRA